MGVSSSHSINDLKDNPLLCQLVGPTPVALEDNFWEELLQFSLIIPDNRWVMSWVAILTVYATAIGDWNLWENVAKAQS